MLERTHRRGLALSRFAVATAFATAFIVACAAPASAAPKEETVRLIVSMTLLPLALFPLGLAVHWLLAAAWPLRSEGLALDLRDHYWKTVLLGVCNGVILLILLSVVGKRPLLALPVLALALASAVGALHGATRNLGEWLLARLAPGKAFGPMATLPLGWFVILFVTCIPVLGWGMGLYWVIRGLGGVALQVAGERAADEAL